MSIAASCNTEQTYPTSNAAILYISVNPPLQARSQCIKKKDSALHPTLVLKILIYAMISANFGLSSLIL